MRKMILASALTLCVAAGAAALRPAVRAVAEEGDELFLPGSYEQYLPLVSPSDVAVNDDYLAIADGSLIYVYSRNEGGNYRVYTHQAGSTIPITISKLQFSDDGRLYFADSAQQFYELTLGTLTPSQPLLALSTFYIAQRTLYAVTVAPATGTTIYKLSMDRPLTIAGAECSQPLSNSPTTPSMTYFSGTLYCALTGTAFAYNGETLSPIGSFRLDDSFGYSLETASVCAVGDAIYYTDSRGLQRTNSEGKSSILYEGSDFRALTTSGDTLYCVKGASVRALALADDKYTGYEIAAASDSVNRLSGATETVRSRDLIVTADSGNERISVYNTRTEEYSVLPCDGTPTCVATDGDVIAAGVGNTVRLYHYGDESPYYVHNSESAIVGVAVVYGECYFITSHSYGVAKQGDREFPRADSPLSIASDLYGNLYVADLQGIVTKYTETEFLDYSASGTVVTDGWSFPATGKSLRADFWGNLYYLNGDAIWQNGAFFTSLVEQSPVYPGGGELPSPASFALSFEDRALYVQYGDFIVRTGRNFPSLTTISSDGLYDEIFSAPSPEELTRVTLAPRTAGILVDLGAMERDSEYYAYLDYARTAEASEAVLLASKDGLALVALFQKEYYGSRESDYEYVYTLALCRESDCTPMETAVRKASGVRYTTNAVSLSYYPCIAGPLSFRQLPRSAEVTLLSVLPGQTFDYAYVEADGETGYLPLSYLSENPPVSPAPDEYILGYLKASREGVLFRTDSGEELRVYEQTRVKLYDLKNGLYLVRFTDPATQREYSAEVTANMVARGNPNALRISVIVILCVVFVGIVATYALLVPRKKKR